MNISIEFKDYSITEKTLTVTSPDEENEISLHMQDKTDELYFWLDRKTAMTLVQFISNQYREL